MKNPVIMHINYCEQGQTLDEVCQNAKKWGFDGVEFRSSDMWNGASDDEYIKNLAECIKRNDIKYYILGYPGADISLENRDEAIANAKEYMKKLDLIAQYLKPLRINFFAGKVLSAENDGNLFDKNGSAAASDTVFSNAIEAGKMIAEHAGKLGLMLCTETHMNYVHDLPDAVLRLIEGIDHPNFKVLLDYGNMVYLKKQSSLQDSFAMLEKHIVYIHLKNSVGLADNVRFPTSLAEGEINHRQYMQLLKNYDGPIAIEAPRDGDREYFAQMDFKYFNEFLR